MKLYSKSELFELDSPIGEPDIKWESEFSEIKTKYVIERRQEKNGTIIWYGQATNWKKEPNKNWTFLTTNENVKPYKDGTFPEGRTYFKPCEMPIYEKLYQQIKH